MQTQEISTPRDNLLGVCHAIGEVFGFNPTLLRIALALVMLVDFELAIGAYAGLGIAVLVANMVARWAARSARTAAA